MSSLEATPTSTTPIAVVVSPAAAMNSSASFHFRQAVESDVKKLLGQAIRDSERAHTGKGIWDIAIGEDNDPNKSLEAVLGHACLNDKESHIYYPHFLVAVAEEQQQQHDASFERKDGVEANIVDEEVVAAGCGFVYPNYATRKSFTGMSLATRVLRGVSEEESIKVWDKVHFLELMFPDYDYDNTWMLDAIFVSGTHRKYGIALQLINRLYDAGRSSGAKECLLVSAIGNVAAYRLYVKAGFECLGEGRSSVAEEVVGYPGFYLFRKQYMNI